jgi:hypothetical protein
MYQQYHNVHQPFSLNLHHHLMKIIRHYGMLFKMVSIGSMDECNHSSFFFVVARIKLDKRKQNRIERERK